RRPRIAGGARRPGAGIHTLAGQPDQALEHQARRPQEGSRQEPARPRRPGHRRVKASAKKALNKSAPAVLDDYLPKNGNPGYQVSRYELDLEYKVSINRLSGWATITAVTLTELQQLTLDLSSALTVSKVYVNGKRPAHFACRGGKLSIRLTSKLATGAALSIAVRYGGWPGPRRSLWGHVGFEELTDGVLSAANPTAPHRGSPATTTP